MDSVNEASIVDFNEHGIYKRSLKKITVRLMSRMLMESARDRILQISS